MGGADPDPCAHRGAHWRGPRASAVTTSGRRSIAPPGSCGAAAQFAGAGVVHDRRHGGRHRWGPRAGSIWASAVLRGLRQPQRLFELLYPGIHPTIDAGSSLTSNLPSPVVRLVGREAERALLLELLDEHRLVTLVGAGGIGKTSLAEDVAVGAAPRFSGGTWFIGLAALGSGDARALGVRRRPWCPAPARRIGDRFDRRLLPRPARAARRRQLRTRHRRGRRVVEAMLRGCPDLTMLATSREPLALHGETRLDLRSLPVPDDRRHAYGDRSDSLRASCSPARRGGRSPAQLRLRRRLGCRRPVSAPWRDSARHRAGGEPAPMLRPVEALERLDAGLGIAA